MLHPFFQGLSTENQSLLSRVIRQRSFAAGQVLFEQGDPADTALFVVSGRVQLSVRLPGGGSLPLAESCGGDLLGELALVERHRRAASAVVIEPLQALEMHRDDLRALCAVHHPASLSMLRRLSRLVASRLAGVNEERIAQRGTDPRIVSRASWRPGAEFDVTRFLPALRMFSEFTERDISAVLELGQLWSVGHDDVILRYGDPPDSCFVVIRGAVKAVIPTPSATKRLSISGPGVPFGIVAVTLQRPQSATYVVPERATLLELPAQAIATMRDATKHVSFPFQEALLRALMVQLEEATRALTGDRRLQPK